MRSFVLFLLVAAAVVCATGCHSQPLSFENVVGQNYEVLGEGEGRATGIMLFNVIPIGQNTRFVRAHQAAIESQGGDALINPVISERWFWGYVLNGYITTVKGTVVRKR
jgi:hypothetical protein